MATHERPDLELRTETQGSASSGRWTWLAAGALLAGAAVVALAPRILPDTAPAATALARHGLTWPLIGGFGLVLAAIASTSRRSSGETHPAEAPPTEPETPAEDPLAREIAGDLARVRGSLQDLRVEFVYVKDGLGRLLQSASNVDADANRETEAAIFRLAASLDQLGGRIEHELATQRTWLQDVLERESRRPIQAPESLPASLPGFANPYAQGFEGAAHEIEVEDGFRSSPDDLHVEVALDEDGGWSNGLGVLDQIDEPRAPLGQGHGKTSWSGRPPASSGLFEEIETGAAELEGKMAQLRQILADPAVQRALDSRTR